MTKDELAIPYDNFQVQLFGDISKEMDAKYRNGRFYKTTLGLGQWTVKDGLREATRIRSLFLPRVFSNPNLKRVSWQKNMDETYQFYKKQQVEIFDHLCQLVSKGPDTSRKYFTDMEDQKFLRVYEEVKAFYGDDHKETRALEILKDERGSVSSQPFRSLETTNEAPFNNKTQLILSLQENFKILEYKEPSLKKYTGTHLIACVYEKETNEVYEILIPVEESENLIMLVSKIESLKRRQA